MQRGRWVFLGAVTLALVGAGSVLVALHVSATGATAPTSTQEHAVRVQVITPKQGGPERTVTRPGTVHSFQYAELYAKVTGYLRNQVVDIGSQVKQDQPLADIYVPEIHANVDKAVADLEKARAQLAVMAARLSATQAELQEAQAKVEEKKADLENAVSMLKLRKLEYQRMKALAAQRAVEQELADEKWQAQQAAESNQRATVKAVETAKAAVASANARVVGAKADKQDAQAQIQVAQALLNRAQIFQDYTTIRAPFAGVITRRNFHDGDFIREGSSQGNKPLLSIARTDKMRVIVDVPDPYVPFTHPGVRADVRVDTLPGQVFSDKVARTAVSEDYNSRTMRTEIDLENPKGMLTNGMFGSVTLHLGANAAALTIPTACLSGAKQDGHRFVYVVRAGKAHRLTVQVGQDDGQHAEILSGLQASDRVIVGHGAGLSEGVPVVVESTKKG